MDLYQGSFSDEEDDVPVVLSLEEYLQTKKSLETIIQKGEALKRLLSNDDFDILVVKGYLTHEPQRLAELMASGRLHGSTMQNCADDIGSVGKFRAFLNNIAQQSNEAFNELASLEEAREEAIRAEEESRG